MKVVVQVSGIVKFVFWVVVVSAMAGFSAGQWDSGKPAGPPRDQNATLALPSAGHPWLVSNRPVSASERDTP
jgi:hypothetical protein